VAGVVTGKLTRADLRRVFARLLFVQATIHRRGMQRIGVLHALDSAAAVNPYLSPTYTMLAWAYTRRGDSALARGAFLNYEKRGNPEPVEHFCMRCVFRLALAMRFLPPDAAQDTLRDVRTERDGPASLALAVRLGLAFGVPSGQLAIGDVLASVPDRAAQTQGLVAQSLALLAMGRVTASLGKLEAATARSGDGEYAFQAMQWRLVLPALGLRGFDEAGREAARAVMSRADTGPQRARADWTLLVDAIATQHVDEARAALDALPDPSALRTLAAALIAAARGDTADALAVSDSLTSHVLAAELEDPLERAVLFLSRGRWLAPRDPTAADAAWGWYENADAVGWPLGHPQGAELDWALETYARHLRSGLAESRGGQALVCALAPDARTRWRDADPAYEPLKRTLDGLLAQCPRR